MAASLSSAIENIPRTFATVTASAAGNTAVIAAVAGQRYRVQGYILEVTGNATLAAAGVLTITLGTVSHRVYLPITGTTAIAGVVYSTGYVNLGKERMVGATNTALNVNLGAALTDSGLAVVQVHYNLEVPSPS